MQDIKSLSRSTAKRVARNAKKIEARKRADRKAAHNAKRIFSALSSVSR